MIGKVIGHYRVTRQIGEGGMGAVYEATHQTIRQRVALKVLHAAVAGDKETRDRFCLEARALSALKHPGVVNVFDYGQTKDGIAYIIMEHLQGESLYQRLRRVVGAVPIPIALHFGRQIAAAVAAAHAMGIVHRDLKPGNVFIVSEPEARNGERIKLLDFGMIKVLQGSGLWSNSGIETMNGVVLGTPAYMAPEQAMAQGVVGAKADVYALGLLLYLMMTGQPAFKGDTDMDVLKMQVYSLPRPLTELVPTAPAEVEALLQVMLFKDPKLRPTMAQVEKRLAELQGESEPDAATLIDDGSGALAAAQRSVVVVPATPAPTRAPVTLRTHRQTLGLGAMLLMAVLSVALGVAERGRLLSFIAHVGKSTLVERPFGPRSPSHVE